MRRRRFFFDVALRDRRLADPLVVSAWSENVPSHLHAILIETFRDQPALAAELLSGPLHIPLPRFDEARLTTADLTDVAPTVYRPGILRRR